MKAVLQSVAATFIAGLLACGAAWADPARVPGTVASVTGDTVVIKSADAAPQNVRLDDKTRITIRTPAEHSILEQGRYVGVTAMPGADGTLVASAVSVFPESRRGTGEGHYPMKDRPAGTTMTNATVKTASKTASRPMGNATVSAATSSHGEYRLTLEYKGGAQTVIVADDVPVVTLSNGDRTALAPGAHVIVDGERGSDGSIAAARISIGGNGSVPPM
ncbi:MAG TPA: DUF5666 domain-containing protein [Casimicrobiaceae bacterium]|jgi:hypothetical protein|nr:DUF5666 domain-containing protein [Casimicrobiaceae bacterium]